MNNFICQTKPMTMAPSFCQKMSLTTGEYLTYVDISIKPGSTWIWILILQLNPQRQNHMANKIPKILS